MSWRKKALDAAERIVLGKQERQKLEREIEAELRKAERRRKR